MGKVEPNARQLERPSDDQLLYKITTVENLIKSIERGYLHFNRVDSYSDFSGADPHDGEQLPADRPAQQKDTFTKAPDISVSDYYDRVRGRTYACCFSTQDSQFIWENYGAGSQLGKVCIVFRFAGLRAVLNHFFEQSDACVQYGDVKCHQIFSVDYGLVQYVDRKIYQGQYKNPIEHAFLKDSKYEAEQEFRITLSAFGLGKFVLKDGGEFEFPSNLQLAFNFAHALAHNSILGLVCQDADQKGHLEGLVEGMPISFRSDSVC